MTTQEPHFPLTVYYHDGVAHVEPCHPDETPRDKLYNVDFEGGPFAGGFVVDATDDAGNVCVALRMLTSVLGKIEMSRTNANVDAIIVKTRIMLGQTERVERTEER